MTNTKDDILPSQIVADLFNESDGYVKYRIQFKPAYTHFLSCVGLEEADFSTNKPRTNLRCHNLFKHLSAIYTLTGGDEKIAEIRPAFEPAIAIETEINGQMKTSLQVIHSFFSNEFEIQRNEFAALGPELEHLQKSRPTEPEMIQRMDKTMNRFIELQRSLKSMIRPGLNSIQAQHLRAIRDCTELYQKQNEHWSRSFASFAKFQPKVNVKPRKQEVKKGTEKAEKLAEDDKDS